MRDKGNIYPGLEGPRVGVAFVALMVRRPDQVAASLQLKAMVPMSDKVQELGRKLEGATSESALWKKYLIKLRQILDKRFNESDLRILCFDLDVDYDNLPGKGKVDKARELVGHLERRNCIPDLIELGKQRRPDISWEDMPEATREVLQVPRDSSEEAGGGDLEFANRKAELRRLTSPIDNPGAPRYVQMYAPSGMGKTYLLKKTRTEYKAVGWFCAWLDFSSDASLCRQTTLILKRLGEQFGAKAKRVRTCAGLAQQVMRAKKQSVIFLDAVDMTSREVRRWIKTDLIPNLEERIPDPKLRPYLIAAGRYPMREWAVYSRQRFDYISLTPFNDTVVDDLLRRFADRSGYDLPHDFFQGMIKAILFITKGHPACIKKVLQEVKSRDFTMQPQEVTQASTFNTTVGTLLDEEILVLHVPEKLREIFKTLCVLRGYTPNLLARLARDGWVPAREYIDWDLESELQRTRLVEIPNSNPLYRIEPLIQQLVALQMKYNNEGKFLGLNRAALEIFEEQVKGEDKDGNKLPNRLYDRMQVALAVEALYHQTTLLRPDKEDTKRTRSKLQGKVSEYLSYRFTRENDNYWVNLLLGAMEKDTELTALMYELTGEIGLEFVLQPLYDFSGIKEG